MKCGFNLDYVELKFEECKLQYQYTLKKQEEVDEQKLIKEQIREEQRAIKEYERAIAEAEKEERMYRGLLDKARQELLEASESERAITEQHIAELEQRLLEAEAKEARAKSMAEQTRKGHVYVISNIGSFGEDVYKIGLTRRLEPMDRVKELGDASVPFPFDVHAMIYAEDAPALEAALHRKFTLQRVNAVNLRKEFFQVDLPTIKDAVDSIVEIDAEFKMTALAEDYYESLRLQTDQVA
ncbi:GIY-YIG nuclease family protein [Shewanella sp. SW36]|uniref:GIY-YIG nuclease family protein n=1 Tax=unclassified Shewanella TaxID=196818 RepID=UPI0021DB3250|nr:MULTISPECIES: GIY-YIG nuclease family protein [unclassified Shewanella]MCU7977529.1 GIY-YIG nuclease family protein [Shewanella sp. SW36]MCU7992786.1 GIY-YIG nuclease family protein [Shewanella sp. SW1]MCU8054031.1 GIY-YIG nuclease family protein [Shewanella sp. SM43]